MTYLKLKWPKLAIFFYEKFFFSKKLHLTQSIHHILLGLSHELFLLESNWAQFSDLEKQKKELNIRLQLNNLNQNMEKENTILTDESKALLQEIDAICQLIILNAKHYIFENSPKSFIGQYRISKLRSTFFSHQKRLDFQK